MVSGQRDDKSRTAAKSAICKPRWSDGAVELRPLEGSVSAQEIVWVLTMAARSSSDKPASGSGGRSRLCSWSEAAGERWLSLSCATFSASTAMTGDDHEPADLIVGILDTLRPHAIEHTCQIPVDKRSSGLGDQDRWSLCMR